MASTVMAQKAFLGTTLAAQTPRSRSTVSTTIVASSGKKIDLKNQGLSSIKDDVVKNNLMGTSRKMNQKGWVDSQGRKGKGFGVYRFANKYGANVDGYSPIYAPDKWSQAGDSYKLGAKGLLAWAGLVLVLFAVGANLIISTSQIGS